MTRIIRSLKQMLYGDGQGNKSFGRTFANVPDPKHGEVLINGDDTYVFDGTLNSWTQVQYPDDG
jgi:hypothetical protein